MEEKYYFNGTQIVKRNDIINYVLIVYEGKACVVDNLGIEKRPLDRAR